MTDCGGVREDWHRVHVDPGLGAIRPRDPCDHVPFRPPAAHRRQGGVQVLGVRPTSGICEEPAGAFCSGTDQVIDAGAEQLCCGWVRVDDAPARVVNDQRPGKIVEVQVQIRAHGRHCLNEGDRKVTSKKMVRNPRPQ